MPLTLQQVINEGILDAIATVYGDPTNARVLLLGIGFPQAMIPPFPSDGARSFWLAVCTHIEAGVYQGGFETLLQAAARTYPHNQVFSRFGTAVPTPPPQSTEREISIIITGSVDLENLLETARALAEELGMNPDSVSLAFANVEGVALNLTNWTDEQAIQLARRLRAVELPESQPMRTTVAASPFRDYLIGQLFVEGPDQARFEINDVRASTPVRDVAQGVIATEYDPKTFGWNGAGRGREVVVDRLNEDGSTERLNPDKTLHDHHIQDGDTLSVSPESTAGTVHPHLREEALARARGQVIEYAKNHPGFQASANSRQVPTEYVFRFKAPSFAPPATPGGEPIEIEEHEVFLILPPGFPMQAPVVFWQTPIFHPNIHPQAGKVCLGALEDHYRPSLDFGELCQLLVDIASYQNYAVNEAYDAAALEWAHSPEGQAAIERRGGQSLTRKILHHLRQPRPLRIRRVDDEL